MNGIGPGWKPGRETLLGEPEAPLADVLDRQTTIGSLWQREGERVRCYACGHRCLIPEGRRGICKVRFVREGQLHVPHGYVAAAACDPVEKKPFYHVYPGSDALTFGMMGCDFHCSYCQNWVTSQALRDPAAYAPIRAATPAGLANAAERLGARLMVSSYNEPLITAEWAVDVFKESKPRGLTCAFVSNGNATPEVLDFIAPWIRAYKIDLKCFHDQRYRKLGGTLKAVLESIRMVHARGLWLELVTLLIPGFNDNDEELEDMAQFIASVSPLIPWHVTAFHPDYQMENPPATAASQLLRAAEIGAQAGLKFVYAGNAPGRVDRWEHTYCPQCQEKVIDRMGFLVREYRLDGAGHCPKCSTVVPGVWAPDPAEVRLGRTQADFVSRRPRPTGSLI